MSNFRLGGSAAEAVGALPSRADTIRMCLECGAAFASQRPEAEFCTDAHRKLWNNRRLVRGAEVYDLFMALRFDRSRSKVMHVFTLISRLAKLYRDEDIAERDGRRSWQKVDRVLDRRRGLLATVLFKNNAGARRRA